MTTAEAWRASQRRVRHELRMYARNPSERNHCYLMGYLKCARDFGELADAPFGYWLRNAANPSVQQEILKGKP